MLPGNTFLHKLLPTMEQQGFDLWGLVLQEALRGLAGPGGFIGEKGKRERREEKASGQAGGRGEGASVAAPGGG